MSTDPRIERASALAREWARERDERVFEPEKAPQDFIRGLALLAETTGRAEAAAWWKKHTDGYVGTADDFAGDVRNRIEDIDMETDGGRNDRDPIGDGYALAVRLAEKAALEEIAETLEGQP